MHDGARHGSTPSLDALIDGLGEGAGTAHVCPSLDALVLDVEEATPAMPSLEALMQGAACQAESLDELIAGLAEEEPPAPSTPPCSEAAGHEAEALPVVEQQLALLQPAALILRNRSHRDAQIQRVVDDACSDVKLNMPDLVNFIGASLMGERRSSLWQHREYQFTLAVAQSNSLLSDTALGTSFKKSYKQVARRRRRLHSALFHIERERFLAMVTWTTEHVRQNHPDWKCLRFSEFPGLDETQHKVKVRREDDFDLVPSDAEVGRVKIDFTDILEGSRVVFYDLAYGMLLRLSPGAYCYITSRRPSTLYTVDRCTGEIYHHLALETSVLRSSLASSLSQFANRDRTAMSDGDAAVNRGERQALMSLGVPNCTLRTCRTHKIANTAKNGVYITMLEEISGNVNTALAQRKGGVAAFRKILARLLGKRARVIVNGAPTAEQDARRIAILDAYLPVDPSKPRSLQDRLHVEAAANGAYETTKDFQMYSRGDLTMRRRDLLQNWMRVTVGSAISPIRVSRWTEVLKPVRNLGLILATHEIGKDAFLAWASAHYVVPRNRQLMALEDRPAEDEQGENKKNVDMDETETFRRELKVHRQKCVDFLNEGDVVAKQFILYSAVAAHQNELMNPALWLGSESWDDHEDTKLLLLEAAGKPSHRTQRVEVVFEQIQERRYLTEIDNLLNNPVRWTALPPGSMTSRLNCLAFRTLEAGAGNVVWNLQDADAVGYPNKAYCAALKALKTGDYSILRNLLEQDDPDLFDPFTRSLWERRELEPLDSMDTLMDTATHGMNGDYDNVSREKGHAWNGRILRLRSHHTHVQCLSDLSGMKVVRAWRRWKTLVDGARDKPGEAATVKGIDSESERDNAGRGNGRPQVHVHFVFANF